MTIEQLNQRFGIPNTASFEKGEGGLTRLVIRAPKATAEIYLQGAHVASYQRSGGQPILWMSKSSWFEAGKPIRGGVPVCFPWFGVRRGVAQPSADSPNHGFARLMEWDVESINAKADGVVEAVLVLRSSDATRKSWPHDFEIRHRVSVGPTLTMTLEVKNTGSQAFAFEEALHTYFTVGDVKKVVITGLAAAEYLSKVEGGRFKQGAPPITFTEYTDRIYFNTPASTVLHDPSMGRRITINKRGSNSTVVWNPWINRAKEMPDFGDDEWPGMCCIETVNAMDNEVTLAPGATHAMSADIS